MKHADYRRRHAGDQELATAREKLRPYLDLAADMLALRLAKGWTQRDLATKMNTRQANISRVENGQANPTLKFLLRLAAALGASLEVRIRSPHRLRSRREEREKTRAPGADTIAADTATTEWGPIATPTVMPGGEECFMFTMNVEQPRTDIVEPV